MVGDVTITDQIHAEREMTLNPFKLMRSFFRSMFDHSHRGVMRFNGYMIVIAIIFVVAFAYKEYWFTAGVWAFNVGLYTWLFGMTRKRHLEHQKRYFEFEDMAWDSAESN